MKSKKDVLLRLMIMLIGTVNFHSQAQQKNNIQHAVATNDASSSNRPTSIVRTIKQDRKGAIWITSWNGIYKYDRNSFTNVTSNLSSARFFSILEDSKSNLWFASIGSGVYHYDGKSFRNFTTKDGLASDRVASIYKDKSGNIWFGTENGVSRYDGKSFRNFKMKEEISSLAATDSVYVGTDPVTTKSDSAHVSLSQRQIPEVHSTHNDVNAIMEDKTGKLWFGTRGNATVFDGKTFTTITNADGKLFTNVRSIIKDKNGNMWIGCADGLWRYDGKTFTNFTRKFVGYIYEDKKGNIWTSSESANDSGWVLSRFDANALSNTNPTVIEINTKSQQPNGMWKYQAMIFGILEANDGSIWFGTMDGVCRYDGKTVKQL